MKELLSPLEEPKVNVQHNLVTRDGELGKELERMKILLARVGGKLGKRTGEEEEEEEEEDDDAMEVDGAAEKRLKDILENKPAVAPRR